MLVTSAWPPTLVEALARAVFVGKYPGLISSNHFRFAWNRSCLTGEAMTSQDLSLRSSHVFTATTEELMRLERCETRAKMFIGKLGLPA